MRNTFKILIILVITAAVVNIGYHQHTKRHKPLNISGVNNLPRKIKMILRTKRLPKHLVLVNINQAQVSYYSDFTDEFWTSKLLNIKNSISRIMQSVAPLPDGYYLLSMEDGIHTEYPLPLLGFGGDRKLVANKMVVLLPDYEAQHGYEQLFESINQAAHKYTWSQKKALIFWRGSATGADFSKDPYNFPRLQFIRLLSSNKHFIDAGFAAYPSAENKKIYKYLTTNFPLVASVKPADALAYKYLLDIDGHSCSYSRMAWILNSNSLLLKHKSHKVQWYYERLQPYVHYIPIQEDFSDLYAQYTWAEENPEQVQTIIANARQLAVEIFTREAIDAATRKAFLDYHVLTQDSR